MHITPADYQVFYEILRSQFIEKEHGGVIPAKARGINSPLIWDLKNEKGNYVSLLRFGGGTTQDQRYFYRKHLELKINKVLIGEIDDAAFAKALKYIGIQVPNDPHKKPMTLKKELDVLYAQFRATYNTADAPESKTSRAVTNGQVGQEASTAREERMKRLGKRPHRAIRLVRLCQRFNCFSKTSPCAILKGRGSW